MAITVGTSASNSSTSSTSVTVSVTIAATANPYLLVFIGHEKTGGATTVSSVTFNGVAMSSVQTDVIASVTRANLYQLINPAVTTANVVVTMSASCDNIQAICTPFYGVDQATPRSAVTTATDGRQNAFIAGAGASALPVGMGWLPGAVSATLDTVPRFVASGALTASSGVTTVTPAGPAGRLYGDVEIASASSENNATHSTSSSGWNKITQTNSGAGWTSSLFYRKYDGSNVDPAITWTGSNDAHGRRHAYRAGMQSNTPVATIGTVGTGSSSTHTSTGGNTTQDNSLATYFDDALANTALATPAGWTEDTDSGSATGPCRTTVGHKNIGASGSATGNISVTGANAAWVQQQLELFLGGHTQTALGNIVANSDVLVAAYAAGGLDQVFSWLPNTTPAGVASYGLYINPSGDVTNTPSTGSLVITGASTTPSSGATNTPATGGLALTGASTTPSAGSTNTPATGALALTGASTTPSSSASNTPSTGALALTGASTTPSSSVASTPGAGSLALTGASTTPSAGAAITPDVIALVITGASTTPTVDNSGASVSGLSMGARINRGDHMHFRTHGLTGIHDRDPAT